MALESADQLLLEVERVGASAVVRLAGSASMNEAGKLKDRLEQLAEQEVPVIVLDLSGLEFISSAGLGAMLSAHGKARPYGGQIRLVHPRPLILWVLETTRLTRLFSVFPSLEQALAS